MTATTRVTLICDLCQDYLYFDGSPTLTEARRSVREKFNWRRDKLGRDVCSRHPKLKGAR